MHALSSSPVRRTVHLLRSGWQRRGIQACHELWMQPFEPFRSAADALGVPAERRRPAYLVLDTTRFQPRTVRAPWRERFDFLVFHPSRLMLAADPVLRATGDWKANGVLLAGFARFLREAPRAGLALIDRPASRDQGAARQLIRDLGIEESVVWLKPPREFGYTRAELLDLYGASDVVADDFGAGWFGSVTLEALALERPVLNFVDERAMAALYPWHPLVNAGSPLEVAAQLTRLYRDPAGRLQGAKQGRQWVEEFHSHTQVQRIYGERLLR